VRRLSPPTAVRPEDQAVLSCLLLYLSSHPLWGGWKGSFTSISTP
jgi:hypothetical protein